MLEIPTKRNKYTRGIIEVLFILLFTFTIVKLFSNTASDFNLPNWYSGQESLSESINEAELENKPHLIYFYTDWCGYCRNLEKDILMNDGVISILDDS